MSARSEAVAQNYRRLERWIVKRENRGLDSEELHDAVRFLKEYHDILIASEVIKNGGDHGTQERG